MLVVNGGLLGSGKVEVTASSVRGRGRALAQMKGGGTASALRSQQTTVKTNAGFPQSDTDGAATGPGSAIHRALVSGRWSTFGPHAIGTERFATVSSGASFAQLAGGILGKRACGQNPDKDEVSG